MKGENCQKARTVFSCFIKHYSGENMCRKSTGIVGFMAKANVWSSIIIFTVVCDYDVLDYKILLESGTGNREQTSQG